MTLARFRAQNHPQQVDRNGARPEVDERATDPEFFAGLDRRFRFTLDVAALARNAKCDRFFSPAENGLEQSWAGERVWCNPPYSSIAPWVEKAWSSRDSAELIVMLLPANRTEQGWWQELVEPYRDRAEGLRTEFLAGRLRFIAFDADRILPNERPPFGCVLLIWASGSSGTER